jgi:diguanylate cyclase (GGDEF)-like protein
MAAAMPNLCALDAIERLPIGMFFGNEITSVEMMLKATERGVPMSEPTRRETQLGIADLKKRLGAVGLNNVQQGQDLRRGVVLFVIGEVPNQTDIAVSEEFLDDLPNTKEYQAMVDSYAHAVAGRLKCGPPELFYCQSGVAIQVSFRWPIQSAVYNNELMTFLLMDVMNRADGKVAKCSVQLGGGRVFASVVKAVNSVRSAVDAGQITFYEPTFHQEVYQRVETKKQPQERRSQADVEQFVAEKAYTGFIAVDEATEVWTVDPWDAQYLGVTVKDLSLAMRVLRANGLLQTGTSPEYVRPTNKLLAERSSRTKREESFSTNQQKLSHKSPPNKDALVSDVQNILREYATFSLVLVDVDNFKSVNDTKGHLEGDACLDKVIEAIETVVGRKGKTYRWGGDEFAICLPDFSTAEALTTAERIRSTVEQAKAGGDIEVTTSIGVCGSDCTESKSPEEFFDFADKAMYESKHGRGRNCVTAWPLSSAGSKTENTPAKRLGERERQKLAESVVLSIKTDNGHQRNYTIQIKNHSKTLDVAIKRISLWSDGQRVGNPAFRPEGENARCWDVAADRELPINFDSGEIVAKRLWSIAGCPSIDAFHDTNLLKGHFRSKVRVEVLYEILGIEKQYEETRTVQVDPINNAITGM